MSEVQVPGRTRAAWFAAELQAAAVRRPRVARLVRVLAAHPVAVTAPVAALVGGLLQASNQRGDAVVFASAADRLIGPHVLSVFADDRLQVGPAYLVVLAGLRALSRLLGLPPAAVSGGALSAVLVAATVRLATPRSARRGQVPTAATWAATTTVLLGGVLAEAAVSGHFEELLTVVLLLAAGRLTVGRPMRAGVVVGLAALVKVWGALGVPVLVARGAPPGPRRFGMAVAAGALSAAVLAAGYLPFALGGTVATLHHRWSTDPSSGLALLTGFTGSVSWQLRLLQALAAACVGLALSVAGAAPERVVLGVVAARLALDPERNSYYWAAFLLAGVVCVWTASDAWARWGVRLTVTAAVPATSMLAYLTSPLADGLLHTVVLTLTAVALVVSASGSARHRRRTGLPAQRDDVGVGPALAPQQ